MDRVLSQTTHLRRSLFQLYHLLETISPLFFIPPSPSNLRPFGAPPSIGRRECPRKPFPWKGLPSAARQGWLPFSAAKPLPLCLPHWGRGTALAVDRVLSLIACLRCISPLIFHTARTLSGSLRSPPSPRGEGFVRRYCFPHMRVFALTMREKRYSRFVAFPIGEGGPRQRWIGCSRISST